MKIILYLMILLVIFSPIIMSGILATIIMGIIRTKAIKSNVLKVVMIIVFLFGVCVTFANIKDERPNDLCAKVRKIDNNESLIGLPKEEVDKLLGEPIYEYKSRDNKREYRYGAGEVSKGIFLWDHCLIFDCSYSCVLNVCFDENDKVIWTSIQYLG